VHVVYLIDSLIAGGAERSLAALAPQYARLGVRLDVAYLYERDNVWLSALEASGAGVHSLAGRRGRAGAVARAAHLLRDQRPDLLHTTLFDADISGRVASVLARVPVVCSLVNAAYGPEQLADPSLRAWKVRAAQLVDLTTARRVRRFHAVSESVADALAARLRIARHRIDVIPRGRDAAELGERTPSRRAAARRALGLDGDARLVLAVGREEYQKGYDVLLRAFASVRAEEPRARLLLAGRPGAASGALRALAGDLGLDTAVEFGGFRADVPELLCAADVFVSTSRWEGSPGGVLEAMALEAPIVAADIPAVRELLDGVEGACLVGTDDCAAFAAGMLAVLRDTDPGERARALRVRFLERFTIERVAQQMVAFYDRALRR
jgi:glycosyltransferase involved in cell wall biosynthesis